MLGIDGLTDYYDINLKKERHKILSKYEKFVDQEIKLEDFDKLKKIVIEYNPDVIIHLAAQAGVRYSLENPRSYIDSNVYQDI